MNIRFVAAILCVGVLVTGCSTAPPKPDIAVYGQMDDFLTQLAARAGKNIGTADTFKIVVTQTQYPIGTLLHAGTTIPIDFTACLPSIAPPKAPAPNLFPSYELSKSLAVGFGLDEAIKTLANFGVSIKDTDKIDLSVKKTQVQALADNDLWKLLAQPECRKAILPAANAWLIRGYILGQRSFVLSNENVRNINGKLEKVGAFNIDVSSGKSSLSLNDEDEVGFLQIVSQIDFIPPKGGKGIKALKLSDLALVVTPLRVIGTSGHVYIQRDRLDTTDRAESVAKQLQENSLAVTTSIEKIDGSYMPRLAQIRYFNDIDKPLALRALQELQKYFPDASLVKVELPAPVGQLEVWFPKVHI